MEDCQFVPFFKPLIGEDEIQAVVQCLRSGWLTTASVTAEFERDFESFVGGDVSAVAVNSCTAALHLALEALGIGPGDEVIVPTLTFTATCEVVRYLGATPVLVDIDPGSLCITPDTIEPFLTHRTKVIIPVHFSGRMCDMQALLSFAEANNLHIVEDAAHALPASSSCLQVGRTGSSATAFSFYANKTITTGEGGMLVTGDPDIAKRARTMRLHGIDRDVFNRYTSISSSALYDVVAPGFKYNLTDIASSIGRVQLAQAHRFHKMRSELANRYQLLLASLPLLLPLPPSPQSTHSWHLYIVQLNRNVAIGRDQVIHALRDMGIMSSIHYRPLHLMSAWKPYCAGRLFPNADIYYENCISLPLFPGMTFDQQDRVVNAIASFIRE